MIIPLIFSLLLPNTASALEGCVQLSPPPVISKRKPSSNLAVAEYFKLDMCRDLEVGEQRSVTHADYDEMWELSNYTKYFGLRPQYTIVRTGEKSYRVTISVDVYQSSDSSVSATAMKARINRCLAQAKPYLKGPNGEQLEIVAADKNGASVYNDTVSGDVVKVEVIPPASRGNTAQFPANFNCAGILHESLHWLGLVDEYEGETIGHFTSACRVQHGQVSIMRNHIHAYEAVVGKIGKCSLGDYFPEEQLWLKKNDNKQLTSIIKEILMRDPGSSAGLTEEMKGGIRTKTDLEKLKYCRPKTLQSASDIPVITKKDLLQWSRRGSGIRVQSFTVKRGPKGAGNPIIHRVVENCDCKANDKACLAYIERYAAEVEDLRQYPHYKCPGERMPMDNDGVDLSQLPPESFVVDAADGSVIYRSAVRGGSLLHPAHFERLIAGACWHKAEKINECMRYAYPLPEGQSVSVQAAYDCKTLPSLKTVSGTAISCNSPADSLGTQRPNWEQAQSKFR